MAPDLIDVRDGQDFVEHVEGAGPEAVDAVDSADVDSFSDVAEPPGPLPEYGPTGFVGTDGVVFRDEEGRMLLLRGVNVSNASKGPPFFPQWFEPEHFQMLAERGTNVVRFLVIWEAVEPEEGVFDAEYLDMVEERVQWATDAGIYVLVDMHQDIWGPKFGGDGAPEWATLDHGLPFNPQPGGSWFLKYGEPAVCQAFQSFWDNEQGIRDHFVMAWQEVAARFADNPKVVGYDIINEPWFGNHDLLDPEGFESDVLTPFYQAVTEGIREVDSNHLVFLEPSAVKGLGWAGGLEPFGDPLVAYAPHYYHAGLEYTDKYTDTKENMAEVFLMMQEEAEALGGPVLMGEFGFYVGAGNAKTYNAHQLELMEELLFSYAAWSFDLGGGWFNLLDAKQQPRWPMDLLTVPYPAHTNGRLLSWHYDRARRTLHLSLDGAGWAPGVTELFVPSSHYRYGVEVTCGDAGGAACSYSYDPEAQRLEIPTGGEGAQAMQITVRPAAGYPPPVPGISTHISLGNAAAREQELAMEEEAGVQMIRRDFSWSKIEPAEGEIHLDQYSDLVGAAGEHGVQVVALLDYSVGWAEAVPGDHSTIDAAAFGAFAGSVAGAFAEEITYYEVWNEENLDLFFKPAPNPKKYGELLKAAADAIRAADPAAVVLFGGLNSVGVFMGKPWEFFELVAEAHADIGNYFDGLAIHPYTLAQSLSPEQENAAGTYADMLHLARVALGRFGMEHKPLFITEMGWPACPCPPLEPPFLIPNVSYQEQARYLVRSYVLAAAAGVDVYLWYDFMDGDGSGEIFSESFFGLVKHDPDPGDEVPPDLKPSYHAYAALTAMMAERMYGGDLSPSAHCHSHLFTGYPQDVLVVWNSHSDAECLVDLPPGGHQVHDLFGEPTGLAEGYLDVPPDGSPRYVFLAPID